MKFKVSMPFELADIDVIHRVAEQMLNNYKVKQISELLGYELLVNLHHRFYTQWQRMEFNGNEKTTLSLDFVEIMTILTLQTEAVYEGVRLHQVKCYLEQKVENYYNLLKSKRTHEQTTFHFTNDRG